jgi:hypothetical protein
MHKMLIIVLYPGNSDTFGGSRLPTRPSSSHTVHSDISSIEHSVSSAADSKGIYMYICVYVNLYIYICMYIYSFIYIYVLCIYT